MMKPYTKLRRFSRQFSQALPPSDISKNESVDISLLSQIFAFETMRVCLPGVFLLDEHLDRLKRSIQIFSPNYYLPSQEEIFSWLEQEIKLSGIKQGVLRLSVLPDASQKDSVQMLMQYRAYEGLSDDKFFKGMDLHATALRRYSPKAVFGTPKSSDYILGILAMLESTCFEPGDTLIASPEGLVGETNISNLFIIQKKRVLTPPISSGILSGVTRKLIIDLAASKLKLDVCETLLTRHDIYNADECFVSNAVIGLLTVNSVDNRLIRRGEVTGLLRQLYQNYMKEYFYEN